MSDASRKAVLLVGTLAALLVSGVFVPAPAHADPRAASKDCAAGYAMARANSTYAGSGIRTGPQQGTSATPRRDELIGTGCVQRGQASATMTFHWASIGEIFTGTFVYQLFDCTSGGTTQELTRRIGFPTGTPATSGEEQATVAVDPAHQYRMRITGDGCYRRNADSIGGANGYWSLRPPNGIEPWLAETQCL